MSKYLLDSTKYYDITYASLPTTNPKLCSNYNKCLTELITKYNITNKSVMSIGCGIGNEEYYFYKHNNELLLYDIDEHHQLKQLIENNLDAIKYDDNTTNKMTFIIDDINNYKQHSLPKQNVIYISSLTIEIVGKNDRYNATGEFFIPLYKNLISDLLNDNGLFILQLYGSSIIPSVDIIKKQFEDLGCILLDLYCFKNAQSIMLIIGIKTSSYDEAKLLYNQYMNSTITCFHGRAYIDFPDNERNKLIQVKHKFSLNNN